ncbi:MAG: transposase, partial [bacterium]|nr:transposase [bacterium]
FSNTILEKKTKRLYADKGYASLKNREILKSRGIKDGIMHKAARNRPLTAREKLKNKLISSKRFIVEQCFGTLKRRFNYWRSHYITREKVEAEFILKSVCFNLLKAINKVEIA